MTTGSAASVNKSSQESTVIVHLLGRLDPGGAEHRLLDLLRQRANREQHVFVALSGRRGLLDEQFERLGCRVVYRALSPTFPAWLIWFLQRINATHVHSHVHLASGYLLALAVAAGVPHRIAHFRSTGDGQPGGWRRWAYRRFGRLLVERTATEVVCVSNAVASCIFGHEASRRRRTPIRVLYNRIDGASFCPRESPEPTETAPQLIVVGRLDRDKNPLRALEILACLRTRRPNASLLLAGRSSLGERHALERQINVLGLAGAVSLLGQSDDVAGLLTQSDMLLATTLREGLPGIVIESAAAGIPAVVSAIAPNEEVALLLPSVVPVPLAATDDAWCDVIEGVLDARADHFHPTAVRQWFDDSPFTLAGPDRELDILWG